MSIFKLRKGKEPKNRWHADFRIVDRLPDTKVIRTKFLINSIAIVAAVILIAIVGLREINKIAIRGSIASLSLEINTRTKANKELARSDLAFRQLSNKIGDIVDFKKVPVRPSQLLVELSRIRIDEVVYETIRYHHLWDSGEKKEVYQLELIGKATSNNNIGRFEQKLKTLKVPENFKLSVQVVGNPSRDLASGLFVFTILIEIEEAKNGPQ